jgi:two-component sensor histidine kinase
MIVLDAILLFLSTILTAGFAFVVKPRRPELVAWALGFASVFVGACLFGLRGMIPDILSLVVANAMIVSFFAIIIVGNDYFRGRKPRFALVAGSALATLAVFFVFGIVVPRIEVRFAYYDLAVAALCAVGAASIAGGALKPLATASRSSAATLACIAAIHLVRLYLGSREMPVNIMAAPAWDGVIQAVSGVLITILCFTLLLMHERRENEALAGAARDRELLVREMAHRTKNDLALVDSLISLERGALIGGGLGADLEARVSGRLEALRDRIRCVADAHDRLSRSEDLGVVRLDGYLEVIASSLPARPGIEIERDFKPTTASFGLAAPLGLAMNELATNALKHAFADGERGTLRLSLWTEAAEGGAVAAVLEVRDDGKGASWPPERPGLGSLIIESFAGKLGGRVDYSFEGGSVFRLSFAIPPEQSRRRGIGA